MSHTFAVRDSPDAPVSDLSVTLSHRSLLLGCAKLHALDVHRMPDRQAVVFAPAMWAEPAGLAWAYTQSFRVHLDPNLHLVLGDFVL